MYKKLFIPGPVDVLPEVLEVMKTPMIGHRSKDASALGKRIHDRAQQLFFTNETILISTSSGSGLMEGAVKSCTSKRAAVFSIGAFGDRWHEMCSMNGIESDIFKAEAGQPTLPEHVAEVLSTGKYDLVTITHNETSTGVMNPVEPIADAIRQFSDIIFCMDAVSSMGGTRIEVDKLSCDICITSTQKCLGLPPGMALASFSKKAVERAKTVKNRGFYLDMLQLYDFMQKKEYQYPSTPCLPLMYGLDFVLERILEEGLDARFGRHAQMAEYVRQWANRYFEVLPQKEYASNTVTTIKNTWEIDVSMLNKKLGERGFEISNGYGNLKDKTFRIAHMAERKHSEVEALISNINEILDLK